MPVPRSLYDREYFLSEMCEGWEEFSRDRGLSRVKRGLVDLLDPGPGMWLLDAGCGRGEVLLECARRGARIAGIDYSAAAVEISHETLRELEDADIRQGLVTELPWDDATFDRALIGDVVEHLEPHEVATALDELHRVLRPGGMLLVHTSPNRLFLKAGWPLARPVLRAAGKGEEVRRLDAWIERIRPHHVNEQSVFGLRRSLRRAGFAEVRAWIDPDVLRGGEHHLTSAATGDSRLFRAGGRIAALRPLRTFLGNDLYATGRA